MRIPSLLASCCLLAFSTVATAAEQPSPAYVQTGATRLGGPDKWDYVLFDASGSRVFVAHGDRTDIVDAHSGRILGRFAPLQGAHGTVVAPELGRGFADSGDARSLTAFDLGSLKPIGTAPAGEDADAVAYDGFSKHVFVMNGDSGTISVIDGATLKSVTTIQMGGKLEFAVADGHGALFVNLAEAGGVARIDTRSNAVTARWPVADCVSPHGMAYDEATQRIFTSCVDGKLKVLDASDGRVVASLAIGKGSDSVAVDAKRRLVFSANSSGTLSIIGIRDANHFEIRRAVKTPRGARTMAVDPATGRIYLASATVKGAAPAHAGAGNSRPSFVPGSLKLLMLDPR